MSKDLILKMKMNIMLIIFNLHLVINKRRACTYIKSFMIKCDERLGVMFLNILRGHKTTNIFPFPVDNNDELN